MYRLVISLSACFLLCASCRGGEQTSGGADNAQATAVTPEASRRLPENIQVTVARGDGWLGTYVATWKGFRTESYWLEGPDGLILIDTQFLPSAGIEAVELAESLTGKKVVAAFALHANPDKFNGTTALQARGIKVYTSAQVLALIPSVHKLRHGWFYDRYKPDYPNEAPRPESFGSETRTMQVAGVELKVHVLGPGCSEAHTVIEYQGHVFVGDLVASLGHSWLELGLLDEWLERLDEIAALKPEYVHPGRGPSGGDELLVRQRQYLERVQAYVAAEKPSKDTPEKDKEAAIERIIGKLKSDYPGYPFGNFIAIGLPEVWDRYAARAAEPAAPGAE